MTIIAYKNRNGENVRRKVEDDEEALSEAKLVLSIHIADKVFLTTIGSSVYWVMQSGLLGYILKGGIKR